LYSAVQQWAHSRLCNYCYTAEDGQKDHQDWMIISFHLPNVKSVSFHLNNHEDAFITPENKNESFEGSAIWFAGRRKYIHVGLTTASMPSTPTNQIAAPSFYEHFHGNDFKFAN